MIDYHVHIGQYKDEYFFPEKVVQDLAELGIDEAWISSTTSCMYCKEFHPEYKNQPSAKEIEDCISGEIATAIKMSSELGVKVHPLFWVVPEFEFCGIHFEDYFHQDKFSYEGFKIHPKGQNWNLLDSKTISLAERVFSFANEKQLTISIHTGEDEIDSPRKFEALIKKTPNAKIILAHLKNLSENLYMLQNYPNVFCDTAFAPQENIIAIKNANFSERILNGSDFPVSKLFL